MDRTPSLAAATTPDTPAESRRRVLAIIGGSSGNLVEWYDFYAYSFLSLYFAARFFPGGNPTTQLLNTAGIFAAGFLVRPLGGWVFGRLADRRGRRFSMMASVLLMCGGSLMIALLPTHDSIGIAAPILLLVARLAQGLSVGGEYGSSATYMSEVAAAHNRGFFASFQYVTLIGGQLLAVLVLVVLEALLDGAQMRAWGWRIPFVIGALAAVVALFLRRALHETQSAEAAGNKDAGSVRALLRDHLKEVLLVMGLTAGGSMSFYVFTTFMQKYLVNTAGMPTRTASVTMAAVLFCFMLLQPLFGALSDRVGRRPMLLVFGLGGAVVTVPLLTALGQPGGPVRAFLLVMAALTVISCYTSISGLVKAELFPASVRALGVGLSYAVANALFGGTAEYIGLWFKSVGLEGGFFWYVTAFLLIAAASAWGLGETRRRGHL